MRLGFARLSLSLDRLPWLIDFLSILVGTYGGKALVLCNNTDIYERQQQQQERIEK